MRESIEDRIIAYFDGRLTDDESADLLHRVSVSPEIRRIFREHEMLREMAHTAQASTVVRPELEASIFSRIEALAAAEQAPLAEPVAQEKDRRKRAVPFFWTRWRIGLAAAVGAFVLGTAVTLGPELFGDDTGDAPSVSSQQMKQPQSGGSQNLTDAPAITPKEVITGSNDVVTEVRSQGKQNFDRIVRGDRDYEARQARNERMRAAGTVGDRIDGTNATDKADLTDVNDLARSKSTTVESSPAAASSSEPIASVSPRSSAPVLEVGGEKNLPYFRAEDIEQDFDDWEISLESSSGFAYPASRSGIAPLADMRIGLGWHLNANNIISFRGTYGLYEKLPDEPTVVDARNYLSVTRNLDRERILAPGLFYTHRIYGVLSPRISMDLSLGGSYLMRGEDDHTISAEVGLRMPISDKFSMIGTFSLTRVHIDANSMDEVIEKIVTDNDGPVLIEGSDVRNTINGRIHYGLSYQF
ncbi:MAG TPA: hypothetical protein VFH43_12040 [Candidatus Kapabacteria bacterium]|nr:hypothetical protein [Candidatus Kapabacteria bacterium]